MEKKVCDRCQRLDEKDVILDEWVTVILERQEGLDYILGKKRKLDLCRKCFNDFWELSNK